MMKMLRDVDLKFLRKGYTFPKEDKIFDGLVFYLETNHLDYFKKSKKFFNKTMRSYAEKNDVYNLFMAGAKTLFLVSNWLILSPQQRKESGEIYNLDEWRKKLDTYNNLHKFMEETLSLMESTRKRRGKIAGTMLNILNASNLALDKTENYIRDLEKELARNREK